MRLDTATRYAGAHLGLVLAIGLSTGCADTTPAPVEAAQAATAAAMPDVDPAVRVSEQRTDALADVVRALRDRDPNIAYPTPDAFWAEVRARHPAEAGLDGWQRPLLYVRDGDMRRFRLYSAGPNGRDEYGVGDDVALREGQTLIE